ncbi:MAG: PDGLE domain-containing protein [Anaerolineae bacterium]
MKRRNLVVAAGLLLAVVVAIFSPLASSLPDGLERVAEDHGFLDRAQEPAYSALPDYTIPGVTSPSLSTILAGIVGVLVVFMAAFAVGALLKRSRPAQASPDGRGNRQA